LPENTEYVNVELHNEQQAPQKNGAPNTPLAIVLYTPLNWYVPSGATDVIAASVNTNVASEKFSAFK
jgi:hypothetical protein